MKKTRMSFMLATFAIAISTAFAFTPKKVDECTLLRKCGTTDQFVPVSSGLHCDFAIDPCEYLSDGVTPCPESVDGCVNPPGKLNH